MRPPLRPRLLAPLVAAACAAGAAPAAASTVVEGDTFVAGGAATYAEVTLDRPMRVAGDKVEEWLDVDLVGEGEILGVEIRGTKLPEDPLRSMPSLIRVWRVGSLELNVETKVAWALTENGSLPAGTYRIYLIADKPASARLRFPGQAGHTRVDTTSTYPFEGGLFEQRTLPDGTLVFGEEHEMRGRGLLLMNLIPYEQDETMVADRLEVCLYTDGAAGRAGAAAFVPGCPGGSSLRAAPRSGPDTRFYTLTLERAPAGLTGFGGNLERVGAESPVYAAGAWVGYVEGDPAASTIPPAVSEAAPPPMLELLTRRLRRARGRALVPVRCPGSGRCRGRVAVGSSRPVAYDLPPGAKRVLRAPLTRRLRRARHASAMLTLLATADSAQQRARIRVDLRPRR